MLSEMSQSEKDKYCMISSTCGKTKPVNTAKEKRLTDIVVTGGRGKRGQYFVSFQCKHSDSQFSNVIFHV